MPKCLLCGRHYPGSACTCSPYEVWLQGEEESTKTTVHAYCEERAAERFCQAMDEGEAPFDRTVIVRHGDEIWTFYVEVEFSVYYFVTEI